MAYDFRQAKKDIEDILNSKVEVEETKSIPDESTFTYENGVKTWVCSLFVDIVSSSKYFNREDISQNVISRIIRSFTEQIVTIINENEYAYEIGIRGDCVYAIFKAEYKKNIVRVFKTAYCINSFLIMFNKILANKKLPLLYAGIGIGTGHDLIVKAGKKKIVHDKIWIGEAVINASNLSKIANRNGYEPICMDETTYENIIEILKEENSEYSNWIEMASSSNYSGPFYQCNIVQTDFDNWIENGMK